ncbi:hypothetical protein F383_24861 [Gossypium arboreum]|uniref:Uncharacterized protein n=1 Tax=Gossypium arboreum TaxID=29729 RepID=A0A0B0NXD8_GOSAR|nr:hypothetical protein F383_24861 [Gossypium arboreum]
MPRSPPKWPFLNWT